MFRSTTPTLYFKIKNMEDLHDIEELLITIKCQGVFLNKTLEDVTINYDEKIISLDLSQEETVTFKYPDIKIQLKIFTTSEKVCVSPIVKIPVDDVLNTEIMGK